MDKVVKITADILKSWTSNPGTVSPFSSSSSQHKEESDNHLEYYVPKPGVTELVDISSMFNSDLFMNGGEKMTENTDSTYTNPGSSTTEPDPNSEIAITKVIDQVTRPTEDVSVSDATEGPVPGNITFPGEGSEVSPTDEEMAEPIEKADGDKCASCGQAMPIAKVADEAETPAEAAAETPADEAKEEMKKSLWGGSFSPISTNRLK